MFFLVFVEWKNDWFAIGKMKKKICFLEFCGMKKYSVFHCEINEENIGFSEISWFGIYFDL